MAERDPLSVDVLASVVFSEANRLKVAIETEESAETALEKAKQAQEETDDSYVEAVKNLASYIRAEFLGYLEQLGLEMNDELSVRVSNRGRLNKFHMRGERLKNPISKDNLTIAVVINQHHGLPQLYFDVTDHVQEFTNRYSDYDMKCYVAQHTPFGEESGFTKGKALEHRLTSDQFAEPLR